jgi:hypothetical protein
MASGAQFAPTAGEPANNEPAPVTLASIELDYLNVKTNYYVGKEFSSEGLVVIANYSDESQRELEASEYTLSYEEGYEFKAQDVGNHLVAVSYENKVAYYPISVERLRVVELEVGGQYKMVYRIGEQFDDSGLVVTAIYNDEDRVEVTDYELRVPSFNTPGEKEIFVTYGGARTSFTVEVREDRWYEVLDEYFEAIGVDFDTTAVFEALAGLSEEVFAEGEISLVQSSSSEYLLVQFPYLNPAASSMAAFFLAYDYALVNPVDVALVEFNYDDFDLDTYSGYFYFEVYSQISESGLYVDMFCDGIDGYSSYGYEDEFRLMFFVQEAVDAPQAAEYFNMAALGPDSIAGVGEEGAQAIDPEDLEEISPYFILSGELDIAERYEAELEELIDVVTYVTNGTDFSQYASYFDLNGLVQSSFDLGVYDVKSYMNALTFSFEYDLGLEIISRPEYDGEDYAEAYAATPDYAIMVYYFVAYDEEYDEYFAEFDFLFTDFAYTTFTDFGMMLPCVEGAGELFLAALNQDELTIHQEWHAMYGDFAVVDDMSLEGTTAWIQVNDYPVADYNLKQNYLNISMFEESALYETKNLITILNYLMLPYLGFAQTVLPDFSEAFEYTMFQSSEDGMQYVFQIFDNHDPYYDPMYDEDESYDNDAIEDLVLAYFENNELWEMDYSQYESSGYIAYSKEAIELLPGQPKVQLEVIFYSYNYMFVLGVLVVPAASQIPVAEVNLAVGEKYGVESGAVEALALADLATLLNGERFVIEDGQTAEGAQTFTFTSENMSEDAYYALMDWAELLLADESWKCNKGSIPSYCTSELVFTHESGLVVRMYYDYGIDWSTWSYYFFGYVTIELADPAGGDPEEQLSFNETLELYAEEGGVDLERLDVLPFAALDELTGVTMEVTVNTSDMTSYPCAVIDLNLNDNATEEEVTAYGAALWGLVEAILADREENPDKYYGVTNYNDDGYDTPIEGTEHTIYFSARIDDGTGLDYDIVITMYLSQEYGARLRVILYGEYEPAPVPAVAGTLESYFEDHLDAWAEIFEVEDDLSFAGNASDLTFEFEELDLEEWGIYGNTLVLSTTAATGYQIDYLLAYLDAALQASGLEYYGELDEGVIGYLYQNEDGVIFQAIVSYQYNQNTGLYTVVLEFYSWLD